MKGNITAFFSFIASLKLRGSSDIGDRPSSRLLLTLMPALTKLSPMAFA